MSSRTAASFHTLTWRSNMSLIAIYNGPTDRTKLRNGAAALATQPEDAKLASPAHNCYLREGNALGNVNRGDPPRRTTCRHGGRAKLQPIKFISSFARLEVLFTSDRFGARLIMFLIDQGPWNAMAGGLRLAAVVSA